MLVVRGPVAPCPSPSRPKSLSYRAQILRSLGFPRAERLRFRVVRAVGVAFVWGAPGSPFRGKAARALFGALVRARSHTRSGATLRRRLGSSTRPARAPQASANGLLAYREGDIRRYQPAHGEPDRRSAEPFILASQPCAAAKPRWRGAARCFSSLKIWCPPGAPHRLTNQERPVRPSTQGAAWAVSPSSRWRNSTQCKGQQARRGRPGRSS